MRKCTQASLPHRSRTRQQLPDRVVGVRGPGPPASGCDKATSSQEVRCALHFLSLSRFSRALSLQLPLVSSQRQKKKIVGTGTRSARAVPTQLWRVEEALGPQRGLV